MRVLTRVRVIAILVALMTLAQPTAAQDQPDPEATISALQTQVAELQEEAPTPFSTPSPQEVVGEGTPASDSRDSSSTGPVNLEVILDVSGSMGQVIDTGETRMEAAKRVLNEVMAVIPDEPGVNVGLRIYGHLGDNTETGRPTSCQSSDLLVPITGVDREAIAEQVAPLVPTGWTPIGLSLERSEADFPTAEEDATNAIVLITDGLETCDGDPDATAASLASGPKEIITHVIGFALTPEEQQILESITGASGGMLLGASNANELSAALFSVLEELEIIVGQGYMGGNAFSLVPAGEPGVLTVVASGAPDPSSGTVPFVVRNNTNQDVYDVRVTATARDGNGLVLAVGDDQGVRPFHIQAGTLGIGHIYFGGVVMPGETTFEFRVESAPSNELRYQRTRDLEIAEASIFEDRIVGQVENPQDGTIEGLIGITVTCLDLNGVPLNDYWEFVETNQLAPGQLVPFQATLYGIQNEGCPAFLVAGNGQCVSCAPIVTEIVTPRASSAPASAAPADEQPDDAAEAEREAAMLAQDPLPGYTDAALRYFRFTGGGLANLGFVAYSVLAFESEALADAALEETAIRYIKMRSEPLDNLLPAQPPGLGDRAIAFTADGTDPQFDFKIDIMAIRDGSTLHVLIGSQMNRSPMPLMEDVAVQGLLPPEQRAQHELVVTGLNEGGLWDIIPRPEVLGDGFLVEDEFVPKMFGPLSEVQESPGQDGTPVAGESSD